MKHHRNGTMKILLKFTVVVSLCAIGLPGAAQVAETSNSQAPPERGTIEYQQKLDREMEAYRREQERLERERHSEKRQEVGDDAYMKRHEVGDENLQRHEVGDDVDMRRHEVGAGDDDS